MFDIFILHINVKIKYPELNKIQELNKLNKNLKIKILL